LCDFFLSSQAVFFSLVIHFPKSSLDTAKMDMPSYCIPARQIAEFDEEEES
jgi:hypothetical protein